LNQKFKKASSKKVEKKDQVEKTMPSTQAAKKSKSFSVKKSRKRSHSFAAKRTFVAKPDRSVVKKELVEKDPVKREIIIEAMTPDGVAFAIGKPVTEVILTLLQWGIVCPKNQLLPEDLVARLAQHYESIPITKVVQDEYAPEKDISALSQEAVKKDKLEVRLPVVVVMGHVDHGKTTLLDFIRNTRVAAKEKGGITQHLGAYEATTSHGGVVFLDTPGHEAFTRIRMRGAKVADIVVLVVAADDSVMPQTIEAIKHAKAMSVPVIVAINKIDKVEKPQLEVVKRDLSQHDLLPEEWGGDIVCVPISAKTGQGVDQLLEMIILQSQMIGLEADKTVAARGYILESKLEKGRGPVATLICQHGTIKKGDFFICGKTVGKVNSLIDSYGKRVEQAGPSIPVRVAGFSKLPEAGDFFRVVSQREYKKARSTKLDDRSAVPKVIPVEGVINIIVKVDTSSSQEALLGSLAKLSKKLEKGFHIIHAAVGDISESDVTLAATTGSIIVGLHVKTEPNAKTLARRGSIDIRQFDIIYKLIENLEEYSESKKEIKKVRMKIGEAVVLKVFDIKNVGVIAGCAVKDGRCSHDGSLEIWRGNEKVGEGPIKSLQREKKTVKEVHAGFECGFLIDGFTDWQVDDRVECYIEVLPDDKK